MNDLIPVLRELDCYVSDIAETALSFKSRTKPFSFVIDVSCYGLFWVYVFEDNIELIIERTTHNLEGVRDAIKQYVK